MDVASMWKILERDYGIGTLDEFKEALQKCKGVDISIFTERIRKDDTERVPDEAPRRTYA